MSLPAIERVIIAPSPFQQRIIADILSRAEGYPPFTPDMIAGMHLPTDTRVVDRTAVVVLPINGLFSLSVPYTAREHRTLPWLPEAFTWARISTGDAQRWDTIVNLLRGPARVYLASEPESDAHHNAIEFLALDAGIPEYAQVQFGIDVTPEAFLTALQQARSHRVDPKPALAQRARAEADYMCKVKLRQCAARFVQQSLGKKTDTDTFSSLGATGLGVMAMVAQRDHEIRREPPPLRWSSQIFVGPLSDTLPNDLLLATDDSETPETYLQRYDRIARIPKTIRCARVTRRREHRDPPPPYTLALLASDLDRLDVAYIPTVIRSCLVQLYEHGAITRPWTSVARYPVWSENRVRATYSRFCDLFPKFEGLDLRLPAIATPIRTVAITPLGRMLTDPTPLLHRVYEQVARRWIMAHLGPATIEHTIAEFSTGNQSFIATTRRTISPGWMALDPIEEKESFLYPIEPETTWQIYERDVVAVTTHRPWHTLASLIDALVDPKQLVDSPEAEQALLPGAHLCRPEAFLATLGGLLADNILLRNTQDGSITLDSTGQLLAAKFGPGLMHPIVMT
ncbi:MAG: DNA topoisomerase, partial [Vulcanimicrobiaceae bacterium]